MFPLLSASSSGSLPMPAVDASVVLIDVGDADEAAKSMSSSKSRKLGA